MVAMVGGEPESDVTDMLGIKINIPTKRRKEQFQEGKEKEGKEKGKKISH